MRESAPTARSCPRLSRNQSGCTPVPCSCARRPPTRCCPAESGFPAGHYAWVVIRQASKDPGFFGADAESFNPYRTIAAGALPYGVEFGVGQAHLHAFIGKRFALGDDPEDPDALNGAGVTVDAPALRRGDAARSRRAPHVRSRAARRARQLADHPRRRGDRADRPGGDPGRRRVWRGDRGEFNSSRCRATRSARSRTPARSTRLTPCGCCIRWNREGCSSSSAGSCPKGKPRLPREARRSCSPRWSPSISGRTTRSLTPSSSLAPWTWKPSSPSSSAAHPGRVRRRGVGVDLRLHRLQRYHRVGVPPDGRLYGLSPSTASAVSARGSRRTSAAMTFATGSRSPAGLRPAVPARQHEPVRVRPGPGDKRGLALCHAAAR